MSKRANNKIVYALSLLILTTLMIGVYLVQPSTSATDTPSASDSADASVTVGEACSMTGSGMSSHSAEVPNGTYQDEIGTTTIKITCNDSAGFSVYAVGYTGDTIGETNSTKLVGRNTNSLISTSTATSGDNSAWAMKVGTNGSATYPVSLQNGFGSYSAIPASYTKVATRLAGTDAGTGATGSTITTTYASFISRTQPADTYDGKVKYTLVHPNDALNPGIKTIANASTLQDVEMCPAELPIGIVYNLIDVRDNQEYKVAKLADGNCWMLDNLAIDPTNSITAANMNETNTNASAAAITNYLNGGNPDNIGGWSNKAVSTSRDNYWTSPVIVNAYKDTLVTSYGLAATNNQAEIGIYYNTCAASVGTYCSGPGSGGSVTQDICPANWRIPTGGPYGEYLDLNNQYNTTEDATETSSLQYNLSTPLSGYFALWKATPEYQNQSGYFLSSIPANDEDMNTLKVGSNLVHPYQMVDYSVAFSLRCLFDK